MTAAALLDRAPNELLPPVGRCLFRQPGAELAQARCRRLLTGIGHDGAKGLLHLRQQGWWTIAQDASSSVVGDMPKSAVEIGAAQEILPLSRIADAITGRLRTS